MTDRDPVLHDHPTADNDPMMARIGYALYLASILTGITALAGLVIAYIYRRRSSGWLFEHYTFLIRTFWIGLFYMALATVLSFLGIGVLLFPLITVWIIVRCARGWRELERQRIPSPLMNWAW
ncbi:DUF4870 family protein [Kushneria phyllosphaerae]|uniref:Transmembrane protein n=1 Tax=Kushneria phyllosphaerae TaxID=2100822 RepID=A0A2R8CN77_9GAMM|nr:hypothetical protein [Kushneria phyllosphaerae]SPJ34345.1 hypothetical protein KSP9073_02379 [Kushneria phyllosphaerae]